MHRFLGRYEPYLYALFRIVAGLLFLCHGAQKILGMFGGVDGHGMTPPFGTLFWFAGIIELVAGTLIAVGFHASWAAFLASGEMAFAFFIGHAPQGLVPILNQGELAVVYCFLFLWIAARGSGPVSVDAALKGR